MGGSAAWFSQMQPGRIYTETRRRATVSATRWHRRLPVVDGGIRAVREYMDTLYAHDTVCA